MKSPFKPFLQKLSDNVGNSLYERLSSPFFQSFAVAWLSVNWEIIYYLLSGSVDKTALERIEYIQQNLSSLNNVLWKPLGLSFGFLIAYIFLSSIGFFIWESFMQIKRWIRGIVQGWERQDEEYVRRLKDIIRDKDVANSKLIEQFGTKREAQQARIDELVKNEADKELKINDLEERLSENEKKQQEALDAHNELTKLAAGDEKTINDLNDELNKLKENLTQQKNKIANQTERIKHYDETARDLAIGRSEMAALLSDREGQIRELKEQLAGKSLANDVALLDEFKPQSISEVERFLTDGYELYWELEKLPEAKK